MSSSLSLENSVVLQTILLFLHIGLGLVLQFFPEVGIIQAALILGIGVAFALASNINYINSLYILGYLIGAEVLWRTLKLSPFVPYEVGKYAAIVFAGIGIVRRYRSIREWPIIPFLFLLCLMPSLVILLGITDLSFARKSLIGHLAGPIAIGVCAIYSSSIRLSFRQAKTFAICVIAPILSLAMLAIYNTWIGATTGTLYFGRSSNIVASGGFGPNQVSNTLALGALMCWLLLISTALTYLEKIFLGFLTLVLCVQTLLTFSRGGMYVFVISTIVSLIIYSLNTKRSTSVRNARPALLLGLGVLVLLFLIIPWANNFTAGALVERYNQEDNVRLSLIISDLEIWTSYPVLGIGPGRTAEFRTQNSSLPGVQPHTEFTRLLAEHGMFGLFAIALLAWGVVHSYLRQRERYARIWIVSIATYTFLYMVQGATRTIAPAVMYALIWTDISFEQE